MEGVTGDREFDAVARRFRHAAGDGGLASDIQEGLEDAASRLDQPIADSIRARLPRGGGLNEVAAEIDVQVSRNGDAGVDVTIRGSIDIEALDAGLVHHPTFGRAPSVEQRVTEGTVSDPIRKSEDDLGQAVEKGIERTARYIEKGTL